MIYWNKYIAAAIVGGIALGAVFINPGGSFLGFVMGWVMLFPIASIAFLVYGLLQYRKDRKNRIMVSIKPNEAMQAIARREAALNREKEILYEELRREMKHE